MPSAFEVLPFKDGLQVCGSLEDASLICIPELIDGQKVHSICLDRFLNNAETLQIQGNAEIFSTDDAPLQERQLTIELGQSCTSASISLEQGFSVHLSISSSVMELQMISDGSSEIAVDVENPYLLEKDGCVFQKGSDGLEMVAVGRGRDSGICLLQGTVRILPGLLPALMDYREMHFPQSLQQVNAEELRLYARRFDHSPFSVDEGNPNLRIREDCLLQGASDEMELLLLLQDKEILRIPEGVTSVFDHAFLGRTVKGVIFPKSLRRIAQNVLEGFASVQRVQFLSTGTAVPLPSDVSTRNRLIQVLDTEHLTYDFSKMDELLCGEYMTAGRFDLLLDRISLSQSNISALSDRFFEVLPDQLKDMIRERQIDRFQQILEMPVWTEERMDTLYQYLEERMRDSAVREMMVLLSQEKRRRFGVRHLDFDL